jgi:hypothetical protein
MAAEGELQVSLVSLTTVMGVLITDPSVKTGVHRHDRMDVLENPAPSTVIVMAVSTGPKLGDSVCHAAEKVNSKGMS